MTSLKSSLSPSSVIVVWTRLSGPEQTAGGLMAVVSRQGTSCHPPRGLGELRHHRHPLRGRRRVRQVVARLLAQVVACHGPGRSSAPPALGVVSLSSGHP